MFFLKKAYCRVFQIGFRAVLPVLPYREPEIIRSCADLVPVLEKEHARTILVVTDRGIVDCFRIDSADLADMAKFVCCGR